MARRYELYLIRHGIAEMRGARWPDDAKRPLSEDGRSRLRKMAGGLARLGFAPDVVLTSPLVRTRQTAELIARALRTRPPVLIAKSLVPGGSYEEVLDDLGRQTGYSRIALIGHEPGIGELGARLIGSPRPLMFKKGAVCRIDVPMLPPDRPGSLRWFLTPKILRRLRR